MVKLLATVIVLIGLGSPFGDATVEGTRIGDHLQVEFAVTVEGAPVAVVVHAVDPGQSQETVSLGNRGGVQWAGVTDLDLMNYVIVFEAILADGEGIVSEPTTLFQLGLDPVLIGMGGGVDVVVDDGDEPLSATTRRWGWGALALAAAALALLAVWAMSDRNGGKQGASHSETPGAPKEPAEEPTEEI